MALFKLNFYSKVLGYDTKFVEKNYFNFISLEAAASHIGVTKNYFARYFKETTGETFNNYPTSVRLKHAVSQLMNTKDTVTYIALENGFPNTRMEVAVSCIYGIRELRENHLQDM